jgi:hypothetical protein
MHKISSMLNAKILLEKSVFKQVIMSYVYALEFVWRFYLAQLGQRINKL